MIVTEAERESFKEAAKPLILWLNLHAHPHTTVIVGSTGAELVEGVCSVQVLDYLKD